MVFVATVDDMQSAYDAMDALDGRWHKARMMPVSNELTELRRSVAAIVELGSEPTRPGLAPELTFFGARQPLGPQRLGEIE